MSQVHIGFPTGIGFQFEAAGRVAATAAAPYRHAPSGSEVSVLAYRLERLAERMRKGELVGPEAVDRVLWSCAGFLLSTQEEPVAIPVTARVVTDEVPTPPVSVPQVGDLGIHADWRIPVDPDRYDLDVPAHQVSEDEDPDEQGL